MNRTILAAAIVAALCAPSVVAWNSYGSYEPDNSLDDPTLMWTTTPPVGANAPLRVYFNAFTMLGTTIGGDPLGTYYAPYTVANPNVAALQTDQETIGSETRHAILGIWRDCNKDGYIGFGEQGLAEYRSELLLDTSVCPPKSGGPNAWPTNPPAFNYNNWVSELIPIGNILANASTDRRLIVDKEAMVWGDNGRPADAADVGGGSTCTSIPERGQSRSTLGLIDFIDCQTEIVATWNAAMDDQGDPLGLRFQDADHPGTQTDHPLYFETLGDDGAEHSAVNAQDCSSNFLITTGNVPVGGNGEPGDNLVPDLDNIGVIRPAPAQPVNGDPTSWTVPGTVNATTEQSDFPILGSPMGERGDCDYANDEGGDVYGFIETDNPGNDIEWKRGAAWNFNFTQVDRGTAPPQSVAGPGRAGMPDSFGLGMPGHYIAIPYTVGNIGSTVRFTAGPSVEPAAAQFYTFYAHVGAATAAAGGITPGGSGTYGSSQCAGITTGQNDNWECDKSKWYLLANGDRMPEYYPLARPGQLYQLRDIDCLDGGVLNGSAGTALPYYGTEPCF